MRIGLDGMPLAQPRTGVGAYTFELARALAVAAPQDEFELISPLPFEETVSHDMRPANLDLIHSQPNLFERRWWTIGLPSYIKRNPLPLFLVPNSGPPPRPRCPPDVLLP